VAELLHGQTGCIFTIRQIYADRSILSASLLIKNMLQTDCYLALLSWCRAMALISGPSIGNKGWLAKALHPAQTPVFKNDGLVIFIHRKMPFYASISFCPIILRSVLFFTTLYLARL
jgi:hypothetical protein